MTQRIDAREAEGAGANSRDEQVQAMQALREDMRSGFADVRTRMDAERAQLVAFHSQVTYILTGLVVALLLLCAVLIAVS